MEVYVDKRDICEIPCDLFGLWHFSDERPLKGINGLLDWRLDAKISQLIISGRIQGTWGEKIMLGSIDEFVGKEIIIVGLGPIREFEPSRMQDAGKIMADTALKLNRETICLALPGSGIPDLDTTVVAENVLFGFANAAGDKALSPWILCNPDDMDEALLGFQKTKISLKSRIFTDIIQVKP
jgi:hypothetical protein